MKISIRNVTYRYGITPVFVNFNIELEGGERPLAIIGPSGSGKTTFLKLLGALLKPQSGEIIFSGDGAEAQPKISFLFQEPRLLPWLTVLDNISIPLVKEMGKAAAAAQARRFLSLVSLEEKENAYPQELSGGQAHRVAMARAFAWTSPVLLMDEPFQSLDIPLKIQLMDLTLSLLAREKRLAVMVTHDPREAVYMGGRIITLGKPAEGIIFDRIITLPDGERIYGSAGAGDLERELIYTIQSRI